MQNTDRLYFAYGSNMHVNQMVTRCPGSTFVGKATLRGWKWQINQRGYANVVKTNNPRNKVEGVVYRLTASDEAQLDLSEGVALGCYEKYVQLVNLVINGSWHGMRAEELEEVLDREEERHVQAEQWLAEMKKNKCRPGVTRTQVLAAGTMPVFQPATLQRRLNPFPLESTTQLLTLMQRVSRPMISRSSGLGIPRTSIRFARLGSTPAHGFMWTA